MDEAMEAGLRRVLTWVLSRLTGCLVAGLVVLAFTQVVLRYVFNSALLWVEEVSVMALIWLAWVGIVYLWLTRAHIAVDLISGILPAAGSRWQAIAIDLLALIGGGALVLVSLGTLEIYAGMELGSLEIDADVKYYPVTAGGAGLSCAAALNLWRRLVHVEPVS